MSVPSRKQAEQAFQKLNPGCDNKINPTELADYLEENGIMSKDKMIEMFADLDKDQDKQISLEEFLDEICKAPRSAALEESFKNIDKDGSGKIDHDECIKGGKGAGLTDEDALEACWDAMDADDNGAVDKTEFLNYMNCNY